MAQNTVVVGSGIIGAACAFYMGERGAKPLVIEACTPACSASGKAGGFLAADWCDDGPVGPLARKSFALHKELAQSLPVDIGYRAVRTHSVAIKAGSAHNSSPTARKHNLPAWVTSPNVAAASVIGTEETTAQVHPELLTKALLAEVEAKGGAVRSRTAVVGLKLDAQTGAVVGVTVRDAATQSEASEEFLPADKVIFAMGVWSSRALRSILPPSVAPVAPVSGLKVHSIIFDDPEGKSTADALFLAYRGNGSSLEPEVYPRPNNTVYVCGISSEEAPPRLADDVLPLPEAIEKLREVAGAVSEELAGAEVLHAQACFLPSSDDGLPMIGPLPGVPGAYLATAHSCWGILNGPATGLAIAELVMDGAASCVDLHAFDPARFSAVRRRR